MCLEMHEFALAYRIYLEISRMYCEFGRYRDADVMISHAADLTMIGLEERLIALALSGHMRLKYADYSGSLYRFDELLREAFPDEIQRKICKPQVVFIGMFFLVFEPPSNLSSETLDVVRDAEVTVILLLLILKVWFFSCKKC